MRCMARAAQRYVLDELFAAGNLSGFGWMRVRRRGGDLRHRGCGQRDYDRGPKMHTHDSPPVIRTRELSHGRVVEGMSNV